MNGGHRLPRRVAIDRLDLDLRGIDPALAEAAVRLLGPALQTAFARRGGALHGMAAARVDAGRVAPASEPQALAERLAQRIAHASTAPLATNKHEA